MSILKNKNIIVTGASGGIGNSIVKRLHECGANILASGTKLEKLEDSGIFKKSLENIYGKINFLRKSSETSVISITSSFKGEGKTTLLVSLAKTMANLGSKVLIIDSNLRNPSFHKTLGLNNKIGLTTYLEDKELQWNDYIQNISEYLVL